MGMCCETKGNLNETLPQENMVNTNVHRGSHNYRNNNQIQKPISNTPKSNYGNNQLISEPSLPNDMNIKRVSMGSSISNKNSGDGMSRITSEIYKKNTNNNKVNTITKFNLTNPKLVQDFTAHDKIIVCMIELHNKLIVTGSYDNTIKIWNISADSNSCEKTINEEGKIFSLLEFEDNMLLASID